MRFLDRACAGFIAVSALLGRVLALPFLMVLVSCSLNDTTASATPEPSEQAATQNVSESPQRLTRPRGKIVGTDGGLLAAGAKLRGTETAGEAVEKWMASQGGADYILNNDESRAWVLRANERH